MPLRLNEYGQRVGEPVPHWSRRPLPAAVTLGGAYCRLEPLDADRHAAELHAAYSSGPDPRDWTYMFTGPFTDARAYHRYAEEAAAGSDPRHYAVIDLGRGTAVGTLSLMRQDPDHGVVEVGNVMFSPLMKRSPVSTEAQFLAMRYVFDDLGYRRYEWKCDSLNTPSRTTAQRLGFTFEGVFRQAVVYKGRNRDTAWYSVIDTEWPANKRALESWLSPSNFDDRGAQRRSLAEVRRGQPPVGGPGEEEIR
ncbi:MULTISPECIES: GNAT family protein [unclassified Streptomyces]|uniref:GNAT family N-acetyltransferase n=1 Tax=unclassified Streptomyces TaxID=2593676 RepID=UPI000DC7B874|nr:MULTISPECIES: GNAT family protein [unclassified Streptomyces]AWZ08203.1 GNAT family N-acetyltransferase [Streptomyces sp. ICC4]AWZ16006.1 GNAT family N-acetyltransferase [Streptomyces sp. ICC1]